MTIPALATLWLSIASLFGLDPCMGPVGLASTGEQAQTCLASSDASDTVEGKSAEDTESAPLLPPVYTISNGF